MESVERESGSSVVRNDAAPDVKMASMTRRNKMRPASDGPPTAATSGVKTSAALVVKNALPANAWHATATKTNVQTSVMVEMTAERPGTLRASLDSSFTLRAASQPQYMKAQRVTPVVT